MSTSLRLTVVGLMITTAAALAMILFTIVSPGRINMPAEEEHCEPVEEATMSRNEAVREFGQGCETRKAVVAAKWPSPVMRIG